MRVSPINVRHQTIDPGSSENIKQDKMLNRIKAKQRNKPKAMSRNVIGKLQKIKDKKSGKQPKGGKKKSITRGTKVSCPLNNLDLNCPGSLICRYFSVVNTEVPQSPSWLILWMQRNWSYGGMAVSYTHLD